jgi:two-component system NarL family sensor kinase
VKLNAPELARQAEESEQMVRELSREIRTTSYLLHPPLLDECGLAESLLWYIRGLKERSGLDVTLAIPEDFGRLTPEMELVIFRIVQECLTNVHRHSGSKVAAIEIKRGPESITLSVQDEGSGIPSEKVLEIESQGGGVGIRGMRERVLQFGGEMALQSGAMGTKISVFFPAADLRPAEEVPGAART